MREVLALILTVAVIYVVYSVFFAPDTPRDTGPPPADSAFPAEVVLSMDDPASVVYRGARYTLGLNLVADHRCPLGQDCPDDGAARVVAWVNGPGARKVEARMSTGNPAPVNAGPFSLTLDLLVPYPRPGHTIAGEDYRATVTVRYAVAEDAESEPEADTGS